MTKPASVGAWLLWSSYVLESQARPFSQRYEYQGKTDPRVRESREEALSVKMLAEKASAACTSNSVGYELLMDFYVREASYWSFTDPEKSIIRKTSKDLARRLREAGFIPPTV